jgi:hypothetical protein
MLPYQTTMTLIPDPAGDQDPKFERDAGELPVPEVQESPHDAVTAASAATPIPVRFAARRQTWTVVAIVLVALATLMAFGALIWQALQPL